LLQETPAAAAPVAVGEAQVRCGACSWADRSLVQEGAFYPRRTMTATARLAHYARTLPLVEVASTRYFPPTPEVARQWAERTPPGFTMDVKGWSLLTGAPTMPDSLWPDLRDEVRPETRDRRRLYPQHLSTDAMDECWARFAHALEPLAEAGRLGAVVLAYPSWFTPKSETRAELAAARDRLGGLPAAVELHSPKWTAGDTCDGTLGFLEDHGLAFVCVDGATDLPPVVASTADLAVVRFVGRRRDERDPGWPWPYRYSDEELAAWVPRVEELAASSPEVHVLFANCWKDDAVDNAVRLAQLLAR
jgi:uncharacterized protein YecE (DUF72 family)